MSRQYEITAVATLGIIGNLILLTFKLIVGFATNSQAMIADGLNSAGDVFASFMTYIGNKIANKPEDTNHPYGHGKADYIFSMIISFSLLLVAFSIFRSSFNALTIENDYIYSPWLIVVAVLTIAVKLALFIFARMVGRKYKSLLVMANAEDHRNDIFLTTLTLISIICGSFGIYFIDSIGGILISFWIAFTGIRIFTHSFTVLMDTTIDANLKKEMEEKIEQVDGVDHVDAIVSKPIGLNFLLIVKVSVDANLTVYQGHEIADLIKDRLMEYDHIDDVVVHVNPTQYHPQRNQNR